MNESTPKLHYSDFFQCTSGVALFASLDSFGDVKIALLSLGEALLVLKGASADYDSILKIPNSYI
jgi:hypothetical protein